MKTDILTEEKIGTDNKVIDIIISVLEKETGKIGKPKLIDQLQKVKIRKWLKEVEFNKDGNVDWKQVNVGKIADNLGRKKTADVATWISNGILASPLMEAVKKIKRKHTEEHPAVYINPEAKMRNKIVEFIGKCDMCSGGLSNHCRQRSVLGIDGRDGCFSDRFSDRPVPQRSPDRFGRCSCRPPRDDSAPGCSSAGPLWPLSKGESLCRSVSL